MLVCALALSFLFTASPEQDVRAVLDQQVAAWNSGDIPKFMETYEQAESTTFMGKSLTRGHAQVLARYTKSYPSRQAMGTLHFSEIEVRLLSDDAALVIGKFHLTRSESAGGDASGRFTLVLRRTSSGWKIIHDHTS